MDEIIWFLFAGTRGGETRARIVDKLRYKPSNANQLSKELSMDYKTVQYHLNILMENNLLSAIKKGSYGSAYFLSDYMKANMSIFEGIWKGFGNK